MTQRLLFQILGFFVVLIVCARPLGKYMAAVYLGEKHPARFLSSIERMIYRVCGVDVHESMHWTVYARHVLSFSLIGFLATYAMQRAQGWLPLNPTTLPAVSPDSSFNTAISFTTNTNWQGYGGETTMSYWTQMTALTVQNFVSAAVGMSVLVALVRGFTQMKAAGIGNFWQDLVRGVLYVLLPLSVVLALLLVSQGVVQTLQPAVTVESLDYSAANGENGNSQTIALGPVASQVAIKQLGTNGGGFFNVNSAHPFENPTPLSNFLEMLAILLIPAALCFTFGEMVGDSRQGHAIVTAMLVILLPLVAFVSVVEQRGNPTFAKAGVDQQPSLIQSGGNMEGKEVRFGIGDSTLWAVATTAASNGSVNSMHDSYMPLGGMVTMWLIQLGEVVFGGVGSGLYGMLIFALVAVFIAGLMVGRTPEYLGKKIGPFEMKMAVLVILFPCAMALIGTALAVSLEAGTATVANPGPHGFSEILYAFSSAANNNGSAFAGLGANTPFYNGCLGLAMLIGRFWVIVPVLAIAGSLASKQHVPAGPGTLPTHTPLFIGLLVAVVVVVGALSFFPALALGPIVEHLLLTATN